ncbi:MAG: hypothetical protein NTW94_03695 [Legionellales bacterium]|nr:hypothetical protein [Legionellales bacterium]
MSLLSRFRFFMWRFGRFQVPMIGYLSPTLIELSDQKIIIRIKLNRRSKNHLKSMYFGALAVGADLAGGLHGFYHAELAGVKVSLVFKSFQANFLKRPESDVYFISDMGERVKEMIVESKTNGQRITRPLEVKAYTNYPNLTEAVAQFTLELSLKVL